MVGHVLDLFKKKTVPVKNTFSGYNHKENYLSKLFKNLKDYESPNVAYFVVARGPVYVSGGLPTQESVGCRKEVSMNNTLNPYQL